MRIPALLRRTGVVACATAVLTGTGTVACSAAVPDTVYDSYVALGDSFTAGPGIPAQRPGDPCGRSKSNYPSLVAAELGITDFVDASCSAADSADLSQPQRPGVPPQYDALRPDTDLVTVGIGGNDIGLVQLALGCVDLGAQPHGASCATTNTAGDTDRVGETIDAFAPTYTAIVDEIRRRSPEARIVFVGYPTGIRDGGCYPVQRIRPDDATYLQAEIDRLNTVMREQVEAAGAEFVDLRESSRGHDACAEPAERWMQGLELTLESIPLHPNAAGHRHAADRVLTELAVR